MKPNIIIITLAATLFSRALSKRELSVSCKMQRGKLQCGCAAPKGTREGGGGRRASRAGVARAADKACDNQLSRATRQENHRRCRLGSETVPKWRRVARSRCLSAPLSLSPLLLPLLERCDAMRCAAGRVLRAESAQTSPPDVTESGADACADAKCGSGSSRGLGRAKERKRGRRRSRRRRKKNHSLLSLTT